MAFHRKNIDVMRLTGFDRQLFEPVFDAWDLKDLSSVSWTEDEVIIDQRHGSRCTSVFVIHTYIIL